jgi:hypothetical protein
MGWPCRPKPGYPAHSATELINRKRTEADTAAAA